MEKPTKSKKNMILKLLPKAAAAAVIFQNPPFSPGREKRLSHLHHNHKGFSGPILIPVEARSRKSNNETTQEPTSPKVSCIGQIKQRKKKMIKTPKPVEKNSVSSLVESNKKKSRSSFRNIFQRGGRKSDACNSAENNISSDIQNRVPCNLSQMKKFASGRESSLSNFDWKNVQITPEDHRKCYSDDDRSEYCDEDEDEDEEEEVIIPFSAPILVGSSRDKPNFPLEPKKEINLWKRRTMTKPNPLQLMKK
ncbi:uncharacterized protein At1g76070 [Nicotiana tabacum]|uniref:Uncharacterized protein At1g76070-like n=2 Tax=Nicotiana TaxID=4085 RepID=A0A1S4A4W5_TOBAC|nr:PREDICTED: uncharacterized protein At1g76070 [Nicotiana sylvestris]XP_016471712.1 PREDICTED: uncharacterized protein At1g76070-like [Nicotiana tabacum]